MFRGTYSLKHFTCNSFASWYIVVVLPFNKTRLRIFCGTTQWESLLNRESSNLLLCPSSLWPFRGLVYNFKYAVLLSAWRLRDLLNPHYDRCNEWSNTRLLISTLMQVATMEEFYFFSQTAIQHIEIFWFILPSPLKCSLYNFTIFQVSFQQRLSLFIFLHAHFYVFCFVLMEYLLQPCHISNLLQIEFIHHTSLPSLIVTWLLTQ